VRRRGDVLRVAAVGDIHCAEQDTGNYRDLLARANEQADILLLAGDLTRHGLIGEFRTVAAELSDVRIPTAAVLGNHDYESSQSNEGASLLRERGVHVLCGDEIALDEEVGIAGVKGFMGGFARGLLTAFGEPETKAFVNAAVDEVHRLEMALRRLSTPVRIALLHYSPVRGTVIGEPENIYPYLGTDRLAEPLDRYAVTAAFHGHAHNGSFCAKTPGGVPVFNVSLSLLRRDGLGPMYYVHEIPLDPPTHSGG
jgi:Icc-related predicted phosphoesterase